MASTWISLSSLADRLRVWPPASCASFTCSYRSSAPASSWASTSLLCIIPMVGWFYVVQDSTTPLGPPDPGFHVWHRRRRVLRLHSLHRLLLPKRLSGMLRPAGAASVTSACPSFLLVGPVLMGFGLFGLTWLAPASRSPATVGGEHLASNAAIFFVPWCIPAAILAFIWLRDVPVKGQPQTAAGHLHPTPTPGTRPSSRHDLRFILGFPPSSPLLINNQFGGQSALNLASRARPTPSAPHRLAHPACPRIFC